MLPTWLSKIPSTMIGQDHNSIIDRLYQLDYLDHLDRLDRH